MSLLSPSLFALSRGTWLPFEVRANLLMLFGDEVGHGSVQSQTPSLFMRRTADIARCQALVPKLEEVGVKITLSPAEEEVCKLEKMAVADKTIVGGKEVVDDKKSVNDKKSVEDTKTTEEKPVANKEVMDDKKVIDDAKEVDGRKAVDDKKAVKEKMVNDKKSKLSLVELTKIAERVIARDQLQARIDATVDTSKADYAIVSAPPCSS